MEESIYKLTGLRDSRGGSTAYLVTPLRTAETINIRPEDSKICRILSLDGGGSKGFYTLGVLHELEGMLDVPLHERFDLVFGTSTGAIIAALIALKFGVNDIYALYKQHVPIIMGKRSAKRRTEALKNLADEVFGDKSFTDVRTGIGIVATKWLIERPMIFKTSVNQAHGRTGTFTPGFGVRISEAVQASCSAYPFFERKIVTTSSGDDVELIDGGFCANNPTLYAIADAVLALKKAHHEIRVVNVGVGNYPKPKPTLKMRLVNQFVVTKMLLEKTLAINTESMDQLRAILFKDVPTIRINATFQHPELATDLLENDVKKLNKLRQWGRESFAQHEAELREFLLVENS